MTRVPADLARLCLAQSGIHVTPATLRSWVHRGHITRTRTGYDLDEITEYIERRDTRDAVSLTAGQRLCNA